MRFFVLFFVFLPLFAADPVFERVKIIGEWEKVLEEDGIEIFLARVPDSKFKAFRARGILKGNIEKYLALFRDVEDMKRWSPKIIEKKVIREISDVEAVTYQIDDIPWPVQDRDLILNNKLYVDKEEKLLKVLLYSVEDPAYPPNDKYVRAEIRWAVFSIRPETKDSTYIDLIIHADPKGSVPAWVVNQIQRKWPYKFLKNSEEAIKTSTNPIRPGVLKLYQELQGLGG